MRAAIDVSKFKYLGTRGEVVRQLERWRRELADLQFRLMLLEKAGNQAGADNLKAQVSWAITNIHSLNRRLGTFK
jgi:hypothetical protein